MSAPEHPHRDTPKGVGPTIKTIVMAAVVGFAVVSFWRGVWYVWDVLTFIEPEDQLLSGLASLGTGIVVLIALKTFGSVFAAPFDDVGGGDRHADR